MQKPYWYKLLDYWINSEDNSGLSIPFLIGVDHEYIRHFAPGTNRIGSLLYEIVNGNAFEYCTTLEYCETIAAYRLGLIKRTEVAAPYFVNQAGEPTLMYKSTEFAENELAAVIAAMCGQYDNLIESGRFSKGSTAFGIWEPFTAGDRSFIKKALS